MHDTITLSGSVGADCAGRRIDQVAAELFPDFSRARLQQWIREGCLKVDGRPVRPAYRVVGGEHLELEARPEPDLKVRAQPIPLRVVAVDDHVLVIDKPAGLVVHPAAGNPDGTLQNGLLNYDPALASIPRAGIVHRLDKDTSGLLVVARSLKAHASLVAQLQDRSMRRHYEAVVWGRAKPAGVIEAPIGRHPRQRQRMAVVASGKPAVTEYRRLEAYRHFSHLEVALRSGRTHQIRVHMQHIGLPLVGDPLYGGRPGRRRILPDEALRAAIAAFPRQALHARSLSFTHPASGQLVDFEAPLPEDLLALLEVLRRHDNAQPS